MEKSLRRMLLTPGMIIKVFTTLATDTMLSDWIDMFTSSGRVKHSHSNVRYVGLPIFHPEVCFLPYAHILMHKLQHENTYAEPYLALHISWTKLCTYAIIVLTQTSRWKLYSQRSGFWGVGISYKMLSYYDTRLAVGCVSKGQIMHETHRWIIGKRWNIGLIKCKEKHNAQTIKHRTSDVITTACRQRK